MSKCRCEPARVAILIVVAVQLLGCHSYSAISRTELLTYLEYGKTSRIQVFDADCNRFEGDTWKIVDDQLVLPDTTLHLAQISIVRKRSSIGPSLLMASVVGVPVGLFTSVMSQLEGDETRFEGFVSGFVLSGLPVFLLMNAARYNAAAWVLEGEVYARRIGKRDFPCRLQRTKTREIPHGAGGRLRSR